MYEAIILISEVIRNRNITKIRQHFHPQLLLYLLLAVLRAIFLIYVTVEISLRLSHGQSWIVHTRIC